MSGGLLIFFRSLIYGLELRAHKLIRPHFLMVGYRVNPAPQPKSLSEFY